MDLYISNTFTFVFLRSLWWGGNGDGVKDTTVFPSIVWITDTLHLVTARLSTERRKVRGLFRQHSKSRKTEVRLTP